MAERELSYQQLDPVGSYGSRPITLVHLARYRRGRGRGDGFRLARVTDPSAALLAIAATAASVARGRRTGRARCVRRSGWAGFLIVTGFAGCALVLAFLATWVESADLIEEWAPIAVGLILVQLSSYRPARELIAATILGGILAAFLVVHPTRDGRIRAAAARHRAGCRPPDRGAWAPAPPHTPRSWSRSLRQWYSRAGAAEHPISPAVKDAIVRSVHDDRVSILSDIGRAVLHRAARAGDSITADDRSRARSIAATHPFRHGRGRGSKLARLDHGPPVGRAGRRVTSRIRGRARTRSSRHLDDDRTAHRDARRRRRAVRSSRDSMRTDSPS